MTQDKYIGKKQYACCKYSYQATAAQIMQKNYFNQIRPESEKKSLTLIIVRPRRQQVKVKKKQKWQDHFEKSIISE